MGKLDLTLLTNVPTDLKEIEEYIEIKKAEHTRREININNNLITTIDIKLPKFKEDNLYEDEKIRNLIPRGLCFIFVNNQYAYTVYGHPKFGNKGDFNNKNLDIDSYKKVFRSKENGECAHWSAFECNDVVYEVFGSKNVHMVVRSKNVEEDLLLYDEPRYLYAKKMGTLINATRTVLALGYLISTGNTLCGEGCFTDSQHLVKYENSCMHFFASTNKRIDSSSPITCVSPLEIDELLTSLGLSKVLESFVCETDDEKTNAESYFEKKNNSEGAVVSCVDKDSNTVYVYKHKNYDYIFMRAIREQMKKYATTQRILKRINELHISHPNHEALVDKFLKFNAFYRQKISEDARKTFFSNWVSWLNKFDELSDEEKNKLLKIHNDYEANHKTLEVIFFVGMPGSGKSSMARVLEKILKRNGKNVKHLEQDMFFRKFGKNASKHYEGKIADVIKDNSLDYLILAKSNHNHEVRKKTYNTLSKCTRNINRTYIVMTTNDQDMKSTSKICVERIMNRGNCHESLFGKSKAEIEGIINSVFVAQWKKLDDDELMYNVINIDINQSREDVFDSFRTQSDVLELGNFVVTDDIMQNILNEISVEDNMMAMKNAKNK